MLTEILKEFDENYDEPFAQWTKVGVKSFLRSSIEKILDEVKLEEKQPLKGHGFDMYADGYHSAIVDLEAKLKSLRE